jgi:hypothetical protein
VVAFLVSLLISALMIGIIVRIGRSRPVGTPLTWGEAFVAGVFVFFLLFLLYGVVPHQWLAFADNQLGWRSDKIGIPLGPLGHALNGKLGAKDGVLFPEGVPLPNGHFIITAQVLRDIIAATLYIVFLVGQILMWLWWQKRDQRKPGDQAELTSAYGRPLVRGS